MKSEFKLINGDCLKEMLKLDKGSVQMVLCDPPFGTTACSWDSVIPFEKMWECLDHVTTPKTPILLFGQNPFTATLIASNIKNYRYDWLWEKNIPTGFLNAKKMPMKKFENISVFYKKLPRYFPIMTKTGTKKKEKITYFKKGGSSDNYNQAGGMARASESERYPTDLLKFDCNERSQSLHPTQKPVPLLEYLIKTYTKKGDTVLDFTMGSGSTGVACRNTGRKFIGIEKNKKYFSICTMRMDE